MNRPRVPARPAPAAEVCEPRTLLTTFVVTDPGDVTDAGDGMLTYREALLAAEAEAGADVITFADGVEGVILEADLPELTGDLSVAGSAAGVTIEHAGFGGLTLSGGTFAFSGVRFENAARDAAAALDVSGGATLTVTGGSFGDNRATADGAGGVVRLVNSDATFTGVLIEDNAAVARGGIAAVGDSDLQLVDVRAVRNDGGVVFAAANGAGDEPTVSITGGEWGLNDSGGEQDGNVRLTAGSLEVTGGRFTFNRGGVIVADDADVTVAGGYFAINRGGVADVRDGTLTVTAATFSTNFGGAIDVTNTEVTVADALFLRNENSGGGAISAEFLSTVTVTDSTFRGNTADIGGAVFVDETSLTLVNARMFGNGVASPNIDTETSRGGAVYVGFESRVTVEGGRVAQNRATRYGGAFFLDSFAESLTLSNLSINRNVAGTADANLLTAGGAVYGDADDPGEFGRLTLDSVFVARNRAVGDRANGGALFLRDTILTVTDSNLAGNSATEQGGAVYLAGISATFTNSFVRGGSARLGGGLQIYDETAGPDSTVVVFTGGGLIGNEATGRGGAIRLAAGLVDPNRLTLDGARVRGNRAANGGAVFAEGPYRSNVSNAVVRVTGDSVVRNNRAENVGGAFAVQGELTLDGVTAVGNRADRGSVAYAFEDDGLGDGVVRVLDALFRGNGDDPLDGPGRIVDRR